MMKQAGFMPRGRQKAPCLQITSPVKDLIACDFEIFVKSKDVSFAY